MSEQKKEDQKQIPFPPPRGVGVSRAAYILGVSQDTVLRFIEDGTLPARRWHDRGWWKIRFEDIVTLANKLNEGQ